MIQNNASTHAPRNKGLSLVELLMALGITALIGVAVTSMLVAVSYGSTSQKELRETSIRLKLTSARIDAAIRSSKRVLESGDHYIVLWIDDTRPDDAPNASEIRLIQLDSTTAQIHSYLTEFPDTWTDQQRADADTPYALADDFLAITTALKTGAYFPSTRWLNGDGGGGGAVAWSLSFDHADAQQAALVSYRLELTSAQDPTVSQTSIASVALRNQ